MYAYLFGNLVVLGVDVLGHSQLAGSPKIPEWGIPLPQYPRCWVWCELTRQCEPVGLAHGLRQRAVLGVEGGHVLLRALTASS